MLVIHSQSPEGTLSIGRALGQVLAPGDFVNLNGTLGAGKTLLVKGIAEGQGVDGAQVTSPTFSLINEYHGENILYHFDLYRLDRGQELEDIGYEEYFFGSGICLVEWGDEFRSYLPEERLDVRFEPLGQSERKITIQGWGPRGANLERALGEVLPCTYLE